MATEITFRRSSAKKMLTKIAPYTKGALSFTDAEKITPLLGATPSGNETHFLFWSPEFRNAKDILLEIFLPTGNIKFDKPDQHANFTYHSFPVLRNESFVASSLKALPVGSKNSFGALYQLKLRLNNGSTKIVRDPMASSIPYGIHAPAEVYDTETLLSNREDNDYFNTLASILLPDDQRVPPAVNMLEVHPQTATRKGTLQSFSNRINQIARKLKNDQPLTPDEVNLTGFEAVELMPIAPVKEHPENHNFWRPIHQPEKSGDDFTVRLLKPGIINWGYDVAIFGSAAVNPSLLSTGRPDELLHLIESLHNFPDPIKVVLDVVYSHADRQAKQVLPEIYLGEESIYGYDLNIQHPMVRAIILEMHRRIMNYGFDGVRVDAAQDFTYYDEQSDKTCYDNQILEQLSNIEQEASGLTYRPWMIFEDGKPWPRDDWELAATYRDVTRNLDYAFQWAPTTFAYNTPHIHTYWLSKWWRIREILEYGDKWITGYANHDTMRRGTQKDPASENVNTLLGNSLKMVMDNAYNNPAATLLFGGFLPGVPMDFLQALGNTPWSFMRDTDTTYRVKVAAEEAYFLQWQVTEVEFLQDRFFKQLKYTGFKTLEGLRKFSLTLLNLIKTTNNNIDLTVKLLNSLQFDLEIKEWSQQKLTMFADAWIEDINDYCNVDHHTTFINKNKTLFNYSVRQFRLNNRWLSNAFQSQDELSYREPVDGAVIVYGHRVDIDTGKEIAIAANIEGQSKQITPIDLDLPFNDPSSWQVACATPSVSKKRIDQPIRLSISQGLIFEKISSNN